MPEPEQQLHKIQILVDHREANSGTFQALSEVKNANIALRRLCVGDYEIDGQLLFERKTLADFAASIKDGRLFRQALRLVNSPIRSAIILEGTAADLVSSGMRREAIQGALISLSVILGIPILRARDPKESARLMVYASRQMRCIARGAIPRKGKRPSGKRNLQTQILQGLPGIGPERARCLLERFGTIESVITAGLGELMEVPGVDGGTAKAIRWAVTESHESYPSWSDDPAL
jgi:DNA excision repair protein ERCC-4